MMGFWHLLAAFAEPPETKPDLWVVVNACVGCAGFAVCYGWCTWKLVLESGLLDEYFEYTEKYLEGLMGGDGDAADGKDNENDDTTVVQSPGGEKAVAKGRGKGGKKRR